MAIAINVIIMYDNVFVARINV